MDNIEDKQKCLKCNISQALSDYYFHSAQQKYWTTCKICDRTRSVQRVKNLPIEKYNDLKTQKKNYYKKNKMKTLIQARKSRLSCRYNMSLEDYDKMYDQQSGVCAICDSPGTSKHQNGNIKKLSIDHCHETGKIRGLLCNKCNMGLGVFKDNLDILKSAILYLEKHNIVEKIEK